MHFVVLELQGGGISEVTVLHTRREAILALCEMVNNSYSDEVWVGTDSEGFSPSNISEVWFESEGPAYVSDRNETHWYLIEGA